MRSGCRRNRNGLIGAVLLLLQMVVLWVPARVQADDASHTATQKVMAPGHESHVAQTADKSALDDIYVDQLIEPGLDGKLFDSELREEEAEPEGRRFLSVGYQYYRDKRSPYDDWENGILVNGRRETLNYGNFDLSGVLRKGNRQSYQDDSGNTQFTLRQFDFAVSEHRVMDNTAGVLRSNADSMISNSFRMNLPSALLLGAKSRISGQDSSLDISAGRIGRLGTGQIQGFDTSDGKLFSLGYNREIGSQWRIGTYALDLENSTDAPDHQSVASAMEYRSEDERQRYKAHLLFDSKGQNGAWLDGDSRINQWRNRYGVFRLERDLLWADTALSNDQQGAYLRSETRSLRNAFTTGLDFVDTNINNDSTRPDNYLYNGFLDDSWRVTHKITIGSTLTLRGSSPRNDAAGDEIRNYVVSGYISRGFAIGTSRLQVSASRLEEGSDAGNGYGIVWDQDWNLRQNLSVSSSLSHENESGIDNQETRSSAALLMRYEMTTSLNWDADISYVRVDSKQLNTQNNLFGSLAMYWRFLRNWDASLRVTLNQFDSNADTVGPDLSGDEKTLLFSVRYSESRGRPFVLLGQKTADGHGYGDITGLVFYDENGDGIRQASEQAARDVVVYLDKRYVATTDSDGRYRFEHITTGKHVLTLALEDLPLPWGLLDDAPRQVNVGIRSGSEVNFALHRIDQ
jgi:hypothetical protein